MAIIEKRGKTYRVRVREKGLSLSKSFERKAEAEAWKLEVLRKIRDGKGGVYLNRTLGDLLEKYAAEVTPKKRGKEWELRRINWILRQPLASLLLRELTPAQLSTWRDARLKSASGETVRRDFNLLSHALNRAVEEWQWLPENPLKRVSRPAGNPPRERIASDDELERLCHAAGYSIGRTAVTATARTAAAFVFSVETGMRSGEILQISLHSRRGQVVTIGRTKNGEQRAVPLSEKACRILEDVGGDFRLTDPQRDALWRKIRHRAGVDGLNFHDARHTAITRLARKLNPLELARMVGHRNINELLTYYNESAEEIAKRLD